MPPSERRRAPAWLVGITYLPFGLYSGFYMVAMPRLLGARGLSLDAIGLITAMIQVPTFASFLLTPLVDCGFARRTWALLLAAISALCLAGAVLTLDRAGAGDRGLFTALLVLGTLTVQMYSSTMGGMTPNLVSESDTGAVSGFLNIANLGGAGFGGFLAGLVVSYLARPAAATAEAVLILGPALLLFVIGAEARRPRAFGTTMRRLFTDLWTVSRTRSALIGLLIFMTPSATFAAINLLSDLGADYRVSDAMMQTLTGPANAVLCSVGALLGGLLANKLDRRMLFVGTGVVAAFAALGMAFGPHTQAVLLAGVSFYYLMAGVNYAACSAAAFDIMGENNPLSATQYSLLMASCNLAIWAVTVGDGRGYKHHGATGFWLVDAAFSLVTGTIMLAVIAKWGGSGRRVQLDSTVVEPALDGAVTRS